MNKNKKILDILKSLFFILYFVILTAERVISLVTTAVQSAFFISSFDEMVTTTARLPQSSSVHTAVFWAQWAFSPMKA